MEVIKVRYGFDNSFELLVLILLYSVAGIFFICNPFDISKTYLLPIFSGSLLVLPAYIFSKTTSRDDDWKAPFCIALAGLLLVYLALILPPNSGGAIFFVLVTLVVILISSLVSIGNKTGFSVGIISFVSILISYLTTIINVIPIGRIYLFKWLAQLSIIIDLRVAILIGGGLLILIDSIITTIKEGNPEISTIPQAKKIIIYEDFFLVSIVNAILKIGIKIWNILIWSTNRIWLIVAHSACFIVLTIFNLVDKVLSFLRHSKNTIAISVSILLIFVISNHISKLGGVQFDYLFSSKIMSLGSTVKMSFILFVFTGLLCLVLMLLEDDDFNEYLEKFTESLLTIGIVYCFSGWLLFIAQKIPGAGKMFRSHLKNA